MTSAVKKYIVQMVFRVNRKNSFTFEEQFRMIECRNREEAAKMAMKCGLKDDSVIKTVDNEEIHWEFIGIIGAWPAEQEEGSVVLWSESVNEKEEKDYIKFVHLRTFDLTANFETKQLIFETGN